MNMWAARLWWMLRVFGFNNAVVLDGGYTKWVQEDRPTDREIVIRSPANFIAKFQSNLIADRDQVLGASEKEDSCLINALLSDEFEGKPPQRYKRSGRIPSSVSVPFSETVDLDSQLYIDNENAKSIFEKVGASAAEEVICYCGGGIAACSTALLLARIGYPKVSVYDGSMNEWAGDISLPIESGSG
jgi:thiosulfate/3-mercaptopyruvate sulfurtransferase